MTSECQPTAVATVAETAGHAYLISSKSLEKTDWKLVGTEVARRTGGITVAMNEVLSGADSLTQERSTIIWQACNPGSVGDRFIPCRIEFSGQY
ncbi:hypothetical protein [Paenibacillus koleovorans]|uniref:hypothetical protein n=1 Tax=Paenibacillus koleovorans TaxID=121608 RepID=UPI000FDC3267|nr:hypothetical protein [Paenibacillus koleovorans]